MDEQTKQLVVDLTRKTTREIFSSMVYMEVESCDDADMHKAGENHLSAMVGFAGRYVGLAVIHCTQKFAGRIAGSMLHMEPDSLSAEDVRDALGEIANMLGGRFKSQLAEALEIYDQVFEQSVPSVISGNDFETFAVTDVPSNTLSFRAGEDAFVIELALKEA